MIDTNHYLLFEMERAIEGANNDTEYISRRADLA